jgi:hypothetical protein
MIAQIIAKMEEIEDEPDFDGWDAWAELKDWLVKQLPPVPQSPADGDEIDFSGS